MRDLREVQLVTDRKRDESIEDQVRVCTDWAQAHGLAVTRVYADRAVSGTTADRPQFQRMLKDAEAGAFATILVYKLDRFARDRFDAAVYRKRLRALGVSLQSAMESIPDGPEGIILESVIEGFNEYYSKNLSQNTRRGMMGNAEKCLTNGVQVYGYREGADGRYEVDEAEAAFVRGAFVRAASSQTRREVVAWLNESGSRTRRGTRWNYNSVNTMITNEKYLGVYSWGGVRVEGGMPALVDRDTFELANGKAPGTKPRANSYALSGKLYDMETGRMYRDTYGTGWGGRQYFYYSVPTGGGHERRYAHDAVDEAVLKAIGSVLAEPGVADMLAAAAVKAMADEAAGGGADAAERELERIRAAQANILKAIEAGIVPDGTAERLEELQAEKRRLEAKVDAARAGVPTEAEVAQWVREGLCSASPAEVLRRAVGRVGIDAEGYVHVEIPWMPLGEPVFLEHCEPKNNDERPVKGQFAEMFFGSPYQIRTGDLRLERAAS